MSEPEDMRSPSEELDTESLPEASVSVSDPPTTPQDTWLSDMDGSRYLACTIITHAKPPAETPGECQL